MNYADHLQAIYDDWEARIKRESEQAGRLKTLQESLQSLYEARFGALPPEVQATLASTEDVEILQQWIVPFATRRSKEIAALMRGNHDEARPAS